MIKLLQRTYRCSTVKVNHQVVSIQDGLLPTKFGDLKMVRNPFLNKEQLNRINKIYYLVDGVGSNFIRSLYKNDKQSILLLDSEQMHIQNANELFQASKRMLDTLYFGTQKKIRNPFVNCKTPQEVFHLHRRILTEQKQFLYRFCLVVSYNGEIRIQGQYPETGDLKYFIDDENTNTSEVKYRKHHYLLPYPTFQGIVTAHSYERQGIAIEQLGNRKIYALYGVWVPSQKQYLHMFEQLMQKIVKSHEIQKKSMINVIDLGCGTGVLGFIANEVLKTELKNPQLRIFGVDNVSNAVKSAKINSQSLEFTYYRAEQADITKKNEMESLLKEHKFPNKYDIIIANPPWIQASKLSAQDALENTVTDPKGVFLKSVFEFAKEHLQMDSIDSSKGRLLLVYSNISQMLGLQDKDRIQELCKEYKMNITYFNEMPFQNKEPSFVDPLLKYKQQSSVQLFEIRYL